MDIWIISVFIPGTGFGILEEGFMSKGEAEQFAAKQQEDMPGAHLTVDNVNIKVTLQ